MRRTILALIALACLPSLARADCPCGPACDCAPKSRKQASDVTKLIAENVALKARLAQVEPPAPTPVPPVESIPPYRVTLANRYGWGWVTTDGTFRPAYGDRADLYDSGPNPKYLPPAPTIPAVRYSAGSACANGRCPR